MNYNISGARALWNIIIATLVACILTVAFASSGWWVLVTMFIVPLMLLGLWVLILTASVRRAPRAPRVLIAALAPMLIFLLIGLYSWAIGVPMGLEMWLRHDMLLAAITLPFLYIVVYGSAFFVPTLGTAIAVYYAVTQHRLRECWTVCMMNLTIGFLSGGIGHLVHAATLQL